MKDLRVGFFGDSQKAFAKRLGRPGRQADISKIEAGKIKADAALLVDIAEAAGLPLDHFQAGGAATLTESDEKRIAAKWMERTAERLRAEATESPSAKEEKEGARRLREAVERGARPKRKRGP